MTSIPSLSDLRMRHDPAGRGLHCVYREDEVNHCPGCGRTHWIIGRVTAECAFCSTAMALAIGATQGGPAIKHRNADRVSNPAWAA